MTSPELTLDELLAGDVVRLMMRRDRVSDVDVRTVFARVAAGRDRSAEWLAPADRASHGFEATNRRRPIPALWSGDQHSAYP